jgi:2,4-didehydro-3-deoxy-L-rhamnonate hydrolase
MRLVSFGQRGSERAGILIDQGQTVVPVASLDPTLPDNVRLLIAGGHLPRLGMRLAAHSAAMSSNATHLPRAGLRLGPPITDPGKIICIGLNYRGHATEQNKPWPEQPLLFAKARTALAGPDDDIVLPSEPCGPDYEVELIAVIGRGGRRIAEASALEHVAGWMVGNDVSARTWQKADGQWFRAKSCDTFFPCGPALVTADDIGDHRTLRLTTTIAGAVLQDSVVSDLIHGVAALIAYVSRDQTLEPGDLISTGTPAGVGCYRTPPRFLIAGDVVECAIDGLGALRNRVVEAH